MTKDHGSSVKDDKQHEGARAARVHAGDRRRSPDLPVYRAPMRAHDRGSPPGAGAEFGLARGVVGIGDALPELPATVEQAVADATDEHGEKAGRILRRFAELPDGSFVWTRVADGSYRLGRIAGPWRYDDSAEARAVGIHHVRPTHWLDRPFDDDEVPVSVAETFARGGRNLQRIRAAEVGACTAKTWEDG